ncbi:MAG: methyltransferase domain-containing protein [Chromatiales bacterium]|nr:methyltransferase domain-containing protein [Chromatiales bacterium]
MPTQCGCLAPTRELALAAPRGDITLRHCTECGHIWNSSFDPALVGFDASYDLSQFYSPSYRRYAASSIDRLMRRYELRSRTALEIACGKGDFLQMMLDAGVGRVIGFDPTYPDDGGAAGDGGRVSIRREMYGRVHSDLHPDIVVCRGCLQYIPEPRTFMANVRETVGDAPDALVYFETSNSALAFRDKVIWYVMYEAGCFFSAPSLARLFRETGFEVLDMIPVLEGAHFEVESRPSRVPSRHVLESREAVAAIGRDIEDFPPLYAASTDSWNGRFARYRRERKRVALWAAGMRAISLLGNCPEAAAGVEVVADVNVRRQGRFLPVTGQPVVSPDALAVYHPDVIVCTNPTYALEISSQVAALGLACEFVVLK